MRYMERWNRALAGFEIRGSRRGLGGGERPGDGDGLFLGVHGEKCWVE